jgi:hypothetical protein
MSVSTYLGFPSTLDTNGSAILYIPIEVRLTNQGEKEENFVAMNSCEKLSWQVFSPDTDIPVSRGNLVDENRCDMTISGFTLKPSESFSYEAMLPFDVKPLNPCISYRIRVSFYNTDLEAEFVLSKPSGGRIMEALGDKLSENSFSGCAFYIDGVTFMYCGGKVDYLSESLYLRDEKTFIREDQLDEEARNHGVTIGPLLSLILHHPGGITIPSPSDRVAVLRFDPRGYEWVYVKDARGIHGFPIVPV